LTQDELQKIIDQLERQTSKDNATFGIFQYGGGSDESCIKADKEGLKLFALELLKASSKTNEIINDKGKNIIPIIFQENWIDDQSDTVIQYVKPVERRQIKDEKKYKETIIDKVLPYGCYAAFIILAIAIIVGFWTLIKWVF